MGATRGPNTVSDNLIFGYDTGYGIANNSTSTRFFPGRPTTNMYTNSDFSNGETGWTFSSWDGNISHTAVDGIIGPYGKPVSALKLTVNNSSSYSHFHQYNNSKYTSGNTYTQSAWVKGTGNMWGKSHWGGNTNFTMTGGWQYITYTVTASSSASNNFPYWGGEGLTAGTVFYMTNVQTEAKPNATPYVATGSRSNTEGLIDLKTTRDINLTNMSFDSTSQPTFDGSDDIITPFDLNLEAMKTSTLEAVIYMNNLSGSDSSYSIFGGIATGPGNGRHGYHEIRNSGSGWKMTHWTSANGWQYANTALSATTWYHVVWVWNGLELKWYLNGEADGTYTYSTFSPYSHGIKNIGAFSSSARLMNGDIPIAKVYDRNLSADEIKQNFNAYKKRFNI